MWRQTGLSVKFFVLDARTCLPMLAFVVYWSKLTFAIAVIGTAFFIGINWCGLTLPAMLRLMRRWVNGPVRTAVPVSERRRFA